MTYLTYVDPPKPTRPFRVGDAVDVVDRNGGAIGQQRVISVKGRAVTTDCGREWTKDGWWKGERDAWPFPSIRLATPSAE